jgi:hypothetical protein
MGKYKYSSFPNFEEAGREIKDIPFLAQHGVTGLEKNYKKTVTFSWLLSSHHKTS